MLERVLFSLAIAALTVALFVVLRHLHRRRASHLAMTSQGQRGSLSPGNLPTGNLPTILYFRSDHCAPCHAQSHHLRQLERDLDGRLAVREIDAEQEGELAARYGIFTLPTTLVTDGQGQVKHINYGLAASATLARQLESVL